jgi:hypothetical protein
MKPLDRTDARALLEDAGQLILEAWRIVPSSRRAHDEIAHASTHIAQAMADLQEQESADPPDRAEKRED